MLKHHVPPRTSVNTEKLTNALPYKKLIIYLGTCRPEGMGSSKLYHKANSVVDESRYDIYLTVP